MATIVDFSFLWKNEEKMEKIAIAHRTNTLEILCLTFKISLFTMQPNLTYVVSVVKLTGAPQPTLKLSTDYWS